MPGPVSPSEAPPLQRGGLGNLLRRTAARTPTQPALRFGETRYSYAELDTACDRAANALSARGVGRGDRVALLSHNNDAFVVLQFAVARLGAILTPINFMLVADEVAWIVDHCAARVLVVEDALVATAEAALDRAGHAPDLLGVIGAAPAGAARGWEAVSGWMLHADATPPTTTVGDDEPIQLMYTSGTESRPKGVTLSSGNLLAQYISCIVDGDMDAADVMVHALPLYHCAQLHCFIGPGLSLGTRNILLPGPDPAAVMRTISEENATQFFAPPTVWISLLRHPDFDGFDLSSLRKGYYGASIMPREVVLELSRRLPELRLFNCYGQTEMSPLATVLRPDDQLRKLGSAGKAVLNVETRIVDDQDRPLPPGIEGEIVHRGPQVMLGYWNDPEKTAEAMRGGWFHSGDLGVMDDEGYLTVVDRKKDMIKTGGENVASREVEEVLYQHPAVAEAAVIGVPDPKWIEAVAAVVVLRAGQAASAEDLIRHCRDRMAGFKTPRRIVFVEDLPRNASGKLLKRELRARFEA